MIARLLLSLLINYKVTLDQKHHRNASIRIDSLFVVTIRINCYVRVNRSFSERYNSFSRVRYKSLQCAYVRYSSHNFRRAASLDRHLSLDMQIS